MKDDFEKKISEFESEFKKIWTRLTQLHDLLSKKTSDFEAEAQSSAQRATESSRIAEEAKEKIVNEAEQINSIFNSIKSEFGTFQKLYEEFLKVHAESKIYNDEIVVTHGTIKAQKVAVDNYVSELDVIFSRKSELEEKINELIAIYTKGDDYDTKISALHKSITERKKEFDNIYYEIFGFIETDVKGTETQVKGKKEELDNAYGSLKANFLETETELQNLKDNTKDQYETFIDLKEKEFTEAKIKWNNDFKSISDKIDGLLPKALTAGLSYAYSEKKRVERKENANHSKTFRNSILGLIAISLIPISVSAYSILQQEKIDVIVYRLPRIVFAILPLYVPVLWVAYSANKKMNLSKRLVEEYTHKEVLSKTFEGLSKQINDVNDEGITSDLKTKLLYNILEVNSENPGKLISDYNKSDHPLMDALDKSVKLTNAVTKLAKLPGFSRLATAIDKKAQVILEKESQKAEAGIEAISEVKTS